MTTKSPESQSSESKTVLNRRGLLKGAVLSAGAAGAAAAAGVIGAGQDAQAASETQAGAGYRETEHVRRAYEAAGF